MKKGEITLQEISKLFNYELIGNDLIINGLNLCNRDSKQDSIISYITSSKYIKCIRQNPKIKLTFLTSDLYDLMKEEFTNISFFVVDNPEEKFYELHNYLYDYTNFYDHYDFDKNIGSNCVIHNSVQIENGVLIGNNVVIGQNSIIKKGSIIGDGTHIGCGSIIGSEGFQLIHDKSGINKLIRHVGGCRLGKSVSIGDCTTICNSLFEDTTLIGDDTKIDNLVHIAHNCIIGNNCVLTAGVILSGSTIIGSNVWISPNSSVSNKVILEDNSFIGIGSVVLNKVKTGTKIFGNPGRKIDFNK